MLKKKNGKRNEKTKWNPKNAAIWSIGPELTLCPFKIRIKAIIKITVKEDKTPQRFKSWGFFETVFSRRLSTTSGSGCGWNGITRSRSLHTLANQIVPDPMIEIDMNVTAGTEEPLEKS